MNCPNCGNTVNDNSAFCLFCGTKMEAVAEEPMVPVEEETFDAPEMQEVEAAPAAAEDPFMPLFTAEEAAPAFEEIPVEEKAAPAAKKQGKQTFCPSCGAETTGKKCASCGKKHSHGGLTAFVIILAVLFAAAAAAGVYLFLLNGEAQEALTARDVTIAQLETSVSSLEDTVAEQEAALTEAEDALTISTEAITEMEASMEVLTPRAEAYVELCELLKTDAIGSQSEVFFADQEYVFVSLSELDKMVTVTANWDEASTITTEYSSDAATLEFPEEEFKTTVQLKVVPQEEGVTVVTFSNSTNEDTFTLAIVVTE